MKTTASTGLHNRRPIAARRSGCALRGALLAVACIVAACGGGSGDGALGVAPEASNPRCGDADLSVLKILVYVSPQGVDGGGCGQTTAAACKSIQQGIDNCNGAACGVLLRHGLYPTTATINLRDAVHVYGGCQFDGEADRRYRTTIQASPAPGTPAIAANAINTATTVHGLVVIGKDETANGSASIAMAVTGSVGLTLSQTALASGRGADGEARGGSAEGSNGEDGGGPTARFAGGFGGRACLASPPPSSLGQGGAGADRDQNDSYGCDDACGCKSRNSAGRRGPKGQNGFDSATVKGGGGGDPGAEGCSCNSSTGPSTDGRQGGQGSAGACATVGGTATAATLGSFSATAWIPNQGNSGQVGDVGSGGGGGGGGGRNVWAHDFTGTDYDGYAAGGGGGGGCSGLAGQGGQQGGASIPLVLRDSKVFWSAGSNSVIPGSGGRGGSGGGGGNGGLGGTGHAGWPGSDSSFNSRWCGDNFKAPGGGGKGGNGGQGGAGSGGAGGNGGPSIGIALVGNSPAIDSSVAIYPQTPGLGGSVGGGGVNPNCTGAAGATGTIGAFAASAAMSQNILTAGKSLRKGQFLTSPNTAYVLLLQTDGNFCLRYSPPGSEGIWCSAENKLGYADTVAMQSDGNLCLSTNGDQGNAKCTNTASHPGAYLTVQDNGSAVIYDGSTVLWNIGSPDILTAGQSLRKGQTLTSRNKAYVLLLQTDGNFCLRYSPPGSEGIWCSAQHNLGYADTVAMQVDGNLCLSTNGDQGNAKCTNTAMSPGAYLILRDDGSAAIYDKSAAELWRIP